MWCETITYVRIVTVYILYCKFGEWWVVSVKRTTRNFSELGPRKHTPEMARGLDLFCFVDLERLMALHVALTSDLEIFLCRLLMPWQVRWRGAGRSFQTREWQMTFQDWSTSYKKALNTKAASFQTRMWEEDTELWNWMDLLLWSRQWEGSSR